MRRLLILFILSFVTAVASAEFKAGKDYWKISQLDGIPVATGDNLFFTWLGCDSCRKLEAELAQELEGFEVVPLIARQEWRPAAKVFYVMQILDGEPDALLKLKQQIDAGEVDPKDQNALFEAIFELGYDKQEVAELLEDRSLYQRINQAEALAKNYAIQYVPTVVVKGQYATDARSTMTVKKFREVLNYLNSL
ncbi:DsbA family protein [Kangiella taiwanensis]|uniref:DSBA-like thioredoxin domain-containing protein n=1 Tax=Kangiella taiwanensis TaxID=1079179 RepID=A0ABP8HWC4_9GAMM|nr:DsbA family protein [Kangiella taiwanensis]